VKTPSARSDNLIFAYGEVPRALELAGRVTRLMRGVIASLEVHPERMWASLEAGFSQATDLAEYVMESCEVDYRTAYLVVGDAVQAAGRGGLRGKDLSGEMLDRAAEARIGRPLGLAGRDLTEVLDPKAIVLTRTSVGGAAPDVVREMAASVRDAALDLRARAGGRHDAYRRAEGALLSRAQQVARG
jgi:argininosuccinate lyase